MRRHVCCLCCLEVGALRIDVCRLYTLHRFRVFGTPSTFKFQVSIINHHHHHHHHQSSSSSSSLVRIIQMSRLPGNRSWRCEVEDVRHYNKYFATLTSKSGDVERSRAKTFFLSSGVSIAYILLLQDISLSPLPKDSKTQQTQISQVDLDRVLKLIEIRNDRIDLMQFCAAMHLIIAKMRLSVDIPSILPVDLAKTTLFKRKKTPPPKPCKKQKPRVKSLKTQNSRVKSKPPPKPCKTQKPRVILKSRHDLKPLEIEDSTSHWVSDYYTRCSSEQNQTPTSQHQIRKLVDGDEDEPYWYNVKTKETTWDPPEKTNMSKQTEEKLMSYSLQCKDAILSSQKGNRDAEMRSYKRLCNAIDKNLLVDLQTLRSYLGRTTSARVRIAVFRLLVNHSNVKMDSDLFVHLEQGLLESISSSIDSMTVYCNMLLRNKNQTRPKTVVDMLIRT